MSRSDGRTAALGGQAMLLVFTAAMGASGCDLVLGYGDRDPALGSGASGSGASGAGMGDGGMGGAAGAGSTGGGGTQSGTAAGANGGGGAGGSQTGAGGVLPTCGDGRLDAGEQCDDAGESADCNADCTVADCGDGKLNVTAAEQCDDGNAIDNDHCSNACTLAPTVTISSSSVFDTTAGLLNGMPVPNWNDAEKRWYSSGFTVNAGVTLTVIGDSPLTIDVAGVALIHGTIDLSGGNGGMATSQVEACDTAGVGGAAGPGGYPGGVGGGTGGTGTEAGGPGGAPNASLQALGGDASTVTDGNFGAAGGGGGGHLNGGQAGGTNGGATAGVGGQFYASLPPLIGGSGGGGGSVEKDGTLGAGLAPSDDDGTGGGGGGGALALLSTASILVTGTIDASGGNGGSQGSCTENMGLGGGGAGGAIHLDSPATNVDGATLDVAGGAGGVSVTNLPATEPFEGGDGAPGRVVVM